MKWTVNQLQNFKKEPLLVNETLDLSASLKEMDPQIIDVSPVTVMGSGETSESKIVFQLHIRTVLMLPCARTLVATAYPIDIQSTETVLFHEEPTTEDVYSPVDHTVDLLPIVQELILSEIPIQIFSDESEQNDLPSSGEGWEVVNEEANSEKIDPRLAGLADFFKKE